ncbi:hypothetical protein SAMN04489727_2135 [Amycolatopsis tolypomycina]|uniref:Uncharacterized protein n=1 Tax=Amycolatopsis tolypomycina TaxID=208445 RepID=A0A1H4JRC2_9PSEU|nr:hypothetical protein [Amycolatopsis tolypomycina]SEB48851.1 hypothetical protein SAMN04489727_2135 [Amycolatopsis tolypomycina]
MTGPEHYREAELIAEILTSGKHNNALLTASDIARFDAAGSLHARLALVNLLAASITGDELAGRADIDRASFATAWEA